MKSVKKLLVVGGGTAGLVAATILKRHLDIEIAVVHSKNIGIVGVGEGSTEHFKDFANFIGIDQYTLIRECDATYKSGIMFSGWGEQDYLHSVIGEFSTRDAQYHSLYAKQIGEGNSYLNYNFIWNNRINKWYFNRREDWPFNQFHFNTFKLNDFLIKIAKDMGIEIIEDDIADVVLDHQGFIKELKGQKTNYSYDFYIDSTGFKRLLINKLGAKWNSYGKYLKMKSAITFPTDDEENYNLWTLAKAMDYGWMFKIPVWGRHGNGYIYDSDYISRDQAKQEVDKILGKDVEVSREFNFDPGCLEKVWIKNCCAIGLSGSFVEPLEATSIGTSIQQSFILMHKLSNYDEKVIEEYNLSVQNIMENIRDFIVLHYITKKENTNFWKDAKNITIPDSLKFKLEKWKHKLPVNEDFFGDSNYTLFRSANFILVMDGLDLFDRNSIYKEYKSLSRFNQERIEATLKNILDKEKNVETVSHKQLIWLIRNV